MIGFEALTHCAYPGAVCGAQIFLLENNGRDRSTASGSQWKEDKHWAGRLDKDWNLAEVKRVWPSLLGF